MPGDDLFDAFVMEHRARLLRTAVRLVKDRHQAEDIVQTALTSTFVAWRRGSVDNVEAYAVRVLVNAVINWDRRRRRRPEVTSATPLEGPATYPIDQWLERNELWLAVSRLPDRLRRVIVLRYYLDLTEAQTAATLGVAQGTVKSQTARAMQCLRRGYLAVCAPHSS
ncbi:SigE family RNA polymerase sigma factor [Catellatospora aurea]|uniref:SigE family RNA polymerase sigma factor n=1 Tax=Catellatospora aurea TaxID=1337874 RepID=A0ABW2H884_9ACTN